MEEPVTGEFIAALPGYPSYFHDESRLSGQADYIVFPEDTAQAAAAIRRAAGEGLPLTIQGARTGIAGGAVPQGGLILSTERMNRPLDFSAGDIPALRVQAGMSFDALGSFLNRSLSKEGGNAEEGAAFRELARNLRFPPNPTETSATLGGAFSCNARGPNSLRWGAAGDHVQALTWITPQGEIWNIDRGRYCFDEAGCPLPGGGRLSCDTALPAGGSRFLHPYPGLDLLDFFAGSEGLAGFAAELTLSLRALPASSWGVVYFFEQEQPALDFAESLREWRKRTPGGEALSTLEYYDRPSLELARNMAPQNAALRRLPPLDPRAGAAVQVELEGDDADALESLLTEQLALFLAAGGREDDTWAAASPAELEKFRILRHAVPELINTELDRIRRELPELYKTAADYTVPPELTAVYHKTYRRDMEEAGLRGFIFGHFAEGRLHVNLLPENREELRRSRTLLDRWAALAVQDGGLLAAENGIGRLKRDLLARHLLPERLEQIRAILRVLDPFGVLNPLGSLTPKGLIPGVPDLGLRED
ncbi:MAG: FAD-binding oxidoreductase [Treponema sp.]|jgi:D-lactate dehydrogenase (cytochrome)|nr:FAD-binding oxidoreductase [Treponema sp.]